MALTPAVFTLGPEVERRFFPVVSHADLFDVTSEGDKVRFHVRFRKLRQCEFLSLAWYVGDLRMPVDFGPQAAAPGPQATRPTGQQRAGPWSILGVGALAGTQAFVLHRCHPLWITITEFYHG